MDPVGKFIVPQLPIIVEKRPPYLPEFKQIGK